MHFDFADLRLFARIAEEENLSRGAKKTFLSPAAASSRLKALEDQLGTRLFYRESKGLSLTPAGERLLRLESTAAMRARHCSKPGAVRIHCRCPVSREMPP